MPTFSVDNFQKDDILAACHSTLFNSGLPGGTLAPLTTTAGLIAAYRALSRHQSHPQHDIEKSVQDIELAVAAGLLTNAHVAAGDTIALLVAPLVAQHSKPTMLADRPARSHVRS